MSNSRKSLNLLMSNVPLSLRRSLSRSLRTKNPLGSPIKIKSPSVTRGPRSLTLIRGER